MARIRSVKPEFWTSEQIVECSANTRLLFIGLWNFCDDYGVHPASCARLKMEIFPNDKFDSVDIRRMVDELIERKLLVEYAIENETYWFVTGWDKHQRPDTKTGKWPRPDGTIGGKVRRKNTENSANEQRQDDDHSPTDKVLDSCSLVLGNKKPFVVVGTTPPCPHQEIIDLYHKHCPTLPRVRDWTGKRQKSLQARWRENPDRQRLDFWEDFFVYVNESDFLTGRNGSWQNCNLEWLVTQGNFVKVIEGNYENRGAA